ncbi:MAG TPA: sulfite exporter TauE/SafE family protein [Burkholderiaceae bacterium]|nr:sulfite exporter TauE/SafE family protein [Burkholderiaceae bacterium]
MPIEILAALALGVFVVAMLYSSVGHAGASGYIAVMTLLALAPAFIKPAALALNVLVAAIAFTQFARAGHFRWPLFWPFALLAPPLAFVGGWLQLPTRAFTLLIGAVLLYSALQLFLRPRAADDPRPPAWWIAVPCGAALGLLSGLTGTGGGIFLTPLLLLAGWAAPKAAAATSALFILVNSAAGLAGHVLGGQPMPTMVLPLIAAAALGGWIGATLGSRRFEPTLIRRLLAAVLVIAGAKLLAT